MESRPHGVRATRLLSSSRRCGRLDRHYGPAGSGLLPLSLLWGWPGCDRRYVAVQRDRLQSGAEALVRIGVDQLWDVTLVDGTAEPVQDLRTKDSFAATYGWDRAKVPVTTRPGA